jgi:hypothetical protein
LDQGTGDVTVLELKSLAKIKENVYGTHEAQLHGQITLLSQYWNQPVFKLEGDSKSRSFPGLCGGIWNINLPEDPVIRGYVLTVSPNDARAFGPYLPDNEKLKKMLERGAMIWSQLDEINRGQRSLSEIPFDENFSPLCDYCRFNKDCPKFTGESCPSLETELTGLAQLKANRARLEEEIKEREAQLKSMALLMGKANQWIKSSQYRFKVSVQKGRQSLDQDILKERLGVSAGLDDESLESILAESRKEGQPFERFYLSPIN